MSRRIPTREAAEYLGIRPPTLKKLRGLGQGPVVIRIGRRLIYDTSDLDAYLEAHRAQEGPRQEQIEG